MRGGTRGGLARSARGARGSGRGGLRSARGGAAGGIAVSKKPSQDIKVQTQHIGPILPPFELNLVSVFPRARSSTIHTLTSRKKVRSIGVFVESVDIDRRTPRIHRNENIHGQEDPTIVSLISLTPSRLSLSSSTTHPCVIFISPTKSERKNTSVEKTSHVWDLRKGSLPRGVCSVRLAGPNSKHKHANEDDQYVRCL